MLRQSSLVGAAHGLLSSTATFMKMDIFVIIRAIIITTAA